jgi:hypothetical protein
MEFNDDLKKLTDTLQQRDDYSTDPALKRVVDILKNVTSQSEFSIQQNLINRITIDGVESWETIQLISSFMTRYSGHEDWGTGNHPV